MAPNLKTVDDKGRVVLGKEFAGRSVMFDRVGNDFVLRFYRAVPDNEAWLWENEQAMAAVRRGIEDFNAGNIVDGPDLDSDRALAESIPFDDEA